MNEIFRVPDGTFNAVPERKIGKTCDLAFGYQGGLNAWRKFELDCFSDDEVEQFKLEWRAAHPQIKKFWYGIDRARWQAVRAQGSSSGFKYGKVVGSLEPVIACCEMPMTIIEPAVWKRALHLRGKDKEGARQLALQRFPAAHALLARKRDHQRGEAALIALFAANRGAAP